MYTFCQIGFGFCVLRRLESFFPRAVEPEVEGRWQQRLSSEITASKSAIVHLVCVIMHTIYKMYKDVAASHSSYGIFLKCRGRVCSLLVT